MTSARTAATTATPQWKRCRPLWFRINTPARILWILASVLLGTLRRRFPFAPERLRVYILVRDLHSTLQPLVEALLAQGVVPAHITFVDTGSTATDCLAELRRLRQQGHRWFTVPPADQPFGPYAPWLCSALAAEIRSSAFPYLLTDADLAVPPAIPPDWLPQLFAVLNAHRFALKASLPLRIDDLTVPQTASIQAHERSLASHPAYRLLTTLLLPPASGLAACTTDTTLSLYRPARQFSTLSIRLPAPYALCHLPWYATFIASPEFRYYTQHKLALFGEWSSQAAHG